MTRLLLWFALFEGAALGVFLGLPLGDASRIPADLLPYAASACACFGLVIWPLLDQRRATAEPRGPWEHFREVALDALLLLLALGPVASVARALAPVPFRAVSLALLPAFAGVWSGAMIALSARLAGNGFRRAGVAFGLTALGMAPVLQFLAGSAGSVPDETVAPFLSPWLFLLALGFPLAALGVRRLGQGASPEGAVA